MYGMLIKVRSKGLGLRISNTTYPQYLKLRRHDLSGKGCRTHKISLTAQLNLNIHSYSN